MAPPLGSTRRPDTSSSHASRSNIPTESTRDESPNNSRSVRSVHSKHSAHSKPSSERKLPRPGYFDGPGSNGSQHSGSESGKPQIYSRIEIPKNIDLGAEAYLLQDEYDAPQRNMVRPGFFPSGKDIKMRINSHKVLSYPTGKVNQYDVIIGSGVEKRGANSAVWNSTKLRTAIGAGWIFDGAKIAWNTRSLKQITVTVDMDEERGRKPNPDRPNKFRVQIKQTKTIGLQGLMAYMENKADFTNECLEAINFLDHLMREIPSRRLFSIKRSYFNKDMLSDNQGIGAGVIAVKGIYQSIRPSMGGMTVNVDVANQCFWDDGKLSSSLLALAAPTQEHQVIFNMQLKDGKDTNMYRNVHRLKRVRFTVKYDNMPERLKQKTFIIERILRTTSRNTMFKKTNPETGESKDISVFDYFWETYRVRLNHPGLPVVEALGKNRPKYPMELCWVVTGQKYPFKLTEIQTTMMIRFAVTRPPVREQAIANKLQMLQWENDPALKAYGLKIDNKMLETTAKVLQPPKVEFAGGKAEAPGTSGRWRLDGKQFIQPNSQPLEVWTVMIFNDWGSPRDKVNHQEVNKFLADFVKYFKMQGGNITRSSPALIEEGNANTIPESIANHWNKAKQITKGREPQLMIFIVTAKNAAYYNRLKRQCDNRFGCVSQVMQSAHVKKCQPQYICNVLLKVFAKLGGFGFRASPPSGKLGTPYPWFTQPTLIVGADVSHGAAGTLQSSIASMTVSMDRSACRYYAMVQTNGRKEEMITTWNIFDMLVPAFREWMMTIGGGRFPKHLIYLRDGVSEGQHQHVLQREVRDIKAVWQELDDTPDKRFFEELKFTVAVASKRHHIRFFPAPGGADKNGNAFPGTLVEKAITHPRDYDFYLCSHSAIQGTARPVHYHVLMDEAKMPVDKFINMIYHHSYQYARSTTPVSIHPAIYYAHLAAKRAVAHDRLFGDEPGDFQHTTSDKQALALLQEARTICDRTGKIMTESARKRLADLERKECPTLIPLGPPKAQRPAGADPNEPAPQIPDPRKFKWSMWYI